MVTARIEMVWNGVSGLRGAVAAAATIVLLMVVKTAGVIAALISGPTALITAENTSPVKAPLTLPVAPPNPKPLTKSVPDTGTTSTMVVAGAIISREGLRLKTYVNVTGNQERTEAREYHRYHSDAESGYGTRNLETRDRWKRHRGRSNRCLRDGHGRRNHDRDRAGRISRRAWGQRLKWIGAEQGAAERRVGRLVDTD